MKRLSLSAIAVLVLVLVTGIGLAQAPVTIRLKDAVEVKAETVTIADVARVEASVPEVEKLIAALTVADAPQINASTKISVGQIRTALGRLPLDMDRITIEGSDTILVSRVGQRITADELQTAVRDHVIKQTGVPEDDLVLEFVRVPAPFAVPAGEVDYTIVPVGNQRLAGYRAFTVGVRVDGADVTTQRVTVKIRLFRPVVVLARRIGRDNVITAERVKLERREVTSTVGSYYLATGDVIGKRATRSISAGVLLTDVMVGKPLAVRRDDYVTLRARKGAVRVRTKCIALADACVGESVDVMNKDSKKVIRARVVAPNVVELEL